jgi:hypothetical protein
VPSMGVAWVRALRYVGIDRVGCLGGVGSVGRVMCVGVQAGWLRGGEV